MKPRVGVFGGAFDPPHNAHVALAMAALAQCDLLELRVFPTGQSWHKAHASSNATHRLAMAQLAFDTIPGARVDAREIRRSGPTYTLDTLLELRRERPDVQPVLIMGSDQAGALPQWHRWEQIVVLAVVCVAERLESAAPGGAGEAGARTVGAAIRFDPRTLPGLPSGARFETLEFPAVATSATDIRERVARGLDIARLVPPAVASYIDRNHLYVPA
ncbi:MAG: nicotinate (nicotinamide) nucleotide adenylyltransferase [Janthinobacterium lividum]